MEKLIQNCSWIKSQPLHHEDLVPSTVNIEIIWLWGRRSAFKKRNWEKKPRIILNNYIYMHSVISHVFQIFMLLQHKY